ncbi:hypothetical protein OROGR_024982 [Orobanche gracilis]
MNPWEFGLLFILVGFVIFANAPVAGESPTCLTVYREGGAPAVFESPKCPRWMLSNFKPQQNRHFRSPSATCQSAMLQGRRKSHEDRTLCVVDLRIPFPGPTGVKEVKIGIMAVFDGHNGSEASEMASELLLEYFVLHTYFLLDTTYSILSMKFLRQLPDNRKGGFVFPKIEWNEDLDHQTLDLGRTRSIRLVGILEFKVTLSAISDGSFPFELLKEALLRAIHDIDITFSKDASRYNISSGTTAAVVLLADTQILVANLGDSKAFLCSEIYQSPSEAKATVFRVVRQGMYGDSTSLKEYYHLKSMASNGWTYLIAKELTNDHHPDRDDEKSRVESAGGNITNWSGVARVNGQLAVSRAIGDIHFKRVTDWIPLTTNDSYVIVASDGVFEKLTTQDICDILSEPLSQFTTSREFNSSCLYSLADCIVNTAFEQGSMDNLAAITIPVGAPGSFGTLEDTSLTLMPFDYLAVGDQRQIYENTTDDNTPVLMELQPLPDVTKFDRLLMDVSSVALILSSNPGSTNNGMLYSDDYLVGAINYFIH